MGIKGTEYGNLLTLKRYQLKAFKKNFRTGIEV